MDTNQIKKVIRILKENNTDKIHLLGGEPTFRKDFIQIMKIFDEEQIPFGFNTNGIILNNNNELLNEIKQNEMLDEIVFSIEGPNALINDNIRGKNVFNKIKGALDKVVKIKNNFNRNFKITINTVLCKTNINYMEEMIDFAINSKVSCLNLLQLINEGNAKNENQAIRFEDELKIVELIAKKYTYGDLNGLIISPNFVMPLAKKYANEVLNLEFPDCNSGCGAGTNVAFIDNKGNLFSCDRYVDQILSKNNDYDINLLNNDFASIWDMNGYGDIYDMTYNKNAYSNIVPCNTCEFLRKACIPCPADIDTFSDAVVKNCNNYKKLIERRIAYNENF